MVSVTIVDFIQFNGDWKKTAQESTNAKHKSPTRTNGLEWSFSWVMVKEAQLLHYWWLGSMPVLFSGLFKAVVPKWTTLFLLEGFKESGDNIQLLTAQYPVM